MELPCWMIKSLPAVLCGTELCSKAPSMMSPIWARCYPRADDPDLYCGQTTWTFEENGSTAAVGWEWVELRKGVAVLADPMSLQSNVEFASGDEQAPLESNKIILLNTMVSSLPWQWHVRKTLETARAKHPPMPRLSRRTVAEGSARLAMAA